MNTMANPNFVCTTCSQTFTRKWRGRVHNNNLHDGRAKIVRLIDYMIGRANGEYRPNDPALFRRKRGSKNGLGNPIEDKRSASGFASANLSRSNEYAVNEYKGVFNKNDLGREQFSYFMDTGSPYSNFPQQSKDSWSSPSFEETQGATIKMAEIKQLASKYQPPQAVQDLLSHVQQVCLLMGNNNPIDMALDSLRRTIAYKESLAYLKSDDQKL
jgi:hypothetical protein